MNAKNAEQGGLTLVLGGARSGKSRFAETLVTRLPGPWLYIATAEALDGEMEARIRAHQDRRDKNWQTIEAPRDLPKAISDAPMDAPLIVDCLTLWLSNLMHGTHDLEAAFGALEEALRSRKGLTVLVSNEVGMGLVPETPLGRAFRDAQGRLNQRMAAIAGRVIFVVAGLPLAVKGGPHE